MKAKIKPRIDLDNRTQLETVVPLSTPYIINVDPTDKCNFKCKFCPTGDQDLMNNTEGRNFGVMDFGLYKKIIDDICEFDAPIKVLRLYKDGEPLLNKKFEKMVKYAKDSGCCDRVDTTTNASALTYERSLKIIDAGLNRINISIEGMSSKQYLTFSKYKVDFDKMVDQIRFFYKNRKQCEMIIKINGDILSEADEKRFYDVFGDIADGVFVENVMACWPDFELNEVEVNDKLGIYNQKIEEVSICPYVFYSFSINSDGRASACYLDWARKLIIGDTKVESVKSIWDGGSIKKLQRMFLYNERKKHHVCKDCGQMTHGMPDNIDQYSDLILSRMNK